MTLHLLLISEIYNNNNRMKSKMSSKMMISSGTISSTYLSSKNSKLITRIMKGGRIPSRNIIRLLKVSTSRSLTNSTPISNNPIPLTKGSSSISKSSYISMNFISKICRRKGYGWSKRIRNSSFMISLKGLCSKSISSRIHISMSILGLSTMSRNWCWQKYILKGKLIKRLSTVSYRKSKTKRTVCKRWKKLSKKTI